MCKGETPSMTLDPCPLPSITGRRHKRRRAVPAPHLLKHRRAELALGVGVAGEPFPTVSALPLVCCEVAWMRERERERDPALLSHPSSSMADGRAWSRVMRAGELAMLLTSCNTQETRPCTLPGKQGEAGPFCYNMIYNT